MTIILGVNELWHHTSAALIKDGEIIGAIEEERLNSEKHQPGLCWGGIFPERSIQWCLDYFGLKDSDIDCLAISFDMNGYLALKIIVDSIVCNLKRMSFKDIMDYRKGSDDPAMSLISGHTIGYFFERPRYLRRMKKRFKKVMFIEHHRAHAASSFRASGFDKANVIVTDGLGEKYGTSLFIGEGNTLTPIKQLDHNYSLGFYYKTITFLLNFGYFGDGKTMGLAGYGKLRPEFERMMKAGDGWYKPDLEVLKELGKYRRLNNDLTQTHKDLAAAVQNGLEKAVQEMLRVIYNRTKYNKLCMAGGVALNCTMNGELLRNSFIDEIFVQPAAMDAGTSLGAALEAYAAHGFQSKTRMIHPYLGPEFSNGQVEHELRKWPFKYEKKKNIVKETAKLLASGKVVGWFQGRLEFGPRALGNRSILANPAYEKIKDEVNRVKGRELWRPLAPAILEEKLHDWFKDAAPSPFMTLSFSYKENKIEDTPAVVHVDSTARLQTVNRETNPRFYDLIKEFEKLTKLPIVINTSFNKKGEPIVCSPMDALDTFNRMEMSYLAINDFLVRKEDKC